MSRQALGLIETVGLAAGIEAADAAVKAANVILIGYELTKGGGMVTVKLAGDVGAIKAAVAAGVAAAQRINQVWGQHIIPRPHTELDNLIQSPDTVGLVPEQPEEPEEKDPENQSWQLEEIRKLMGYGSQPEKPEFTCNLCHDPACPRQRGEARVKCIHHKTENNEK